MKVLFVLNNIYEKGNGLCTSAQVTVKYLREAGVDARFLAGKNSDPNGPQPDFPLERFKFPIFQPLIEANGFCFVKSDEEMIRKAVAWADVIHLEEAFPLEKKTIDIAKEMGKPLVGTVHLYTQNVMGELPIPIWGKPNDWYMKIWRDKYWRNCSDISCPTSVLRDHLKKWNFSARLHVISNGIRIPEERVIAQSVNTPPYVLLSVGRFSRVKDQETLLNAMNFSKYAKQIQLYFAGKGSMQKSLEKHAHKLVAQGVLSKEYAPVFAFHKHEDLRKIAGNSYLYIHCAKLEVEGLGCIEALREGTVPVISKAELVGTTDFALDERSIYPGGDAKALAAKIDWWIEHPAERNEMAQKYADFAREFDVHKSIEKMIKMYETALASNNQQ